MRTAVRDRNTGRAQAAAQGCGEIANAFATLWLVFDDGQACGECRGDRRRRRRREDERPGALNQVIDRPCGTGDKRAGNTKRLPSGVDRHKYLVRDSMFFDETASVLTVDANRVRLVDDQMRTTL